eukprot:gene1752-521_t
MNSQDWKCSKCSFMNFRNRTECKNCSNKKLTTGFDNSGDWNCTKCYFKNFRKNTCCKNCSEPKNNHVNSVSGKEVKIQILKGEKQYKNSNISVHFAIDVSGSMSGYKLETVKKCFSIIFNKILQPDDLISITTFSSDIQKIMSDVKKKDINLNDLLSKIKIGSTTSLYDAICNVMDHELKSKQENKCEIILLTDGRDLGSFKSEHDARDIIRKISQIDAHFTIIGIGKDVYEQTLKHLCVCKKTHYSQYTEKEIMKSFASVAQKIAKEKMDLMITLKMSTDDVQKSLDSAMKLLKEIQ